MELNKPKDYYKILGIARAATAQEIKQAFRAKAKAFHPDRNPGNPRAKARFVQAQEAYDVLSDVEERAKFDRRLHAYERFSRVGGRARSMQGHKNGQGSFLERLFGLGGRKQHITITLPFEKAFRGGLTVIRVPGDRPVRVDLPEGIRSGYTIHIKDISGPPLQVRFKVTPDKRYKMMNNNLVMKEPLTVGALEAMLGGSRQLSHPSGTQVSVAIPPGTQPGDLLRVRGKGVRGGDMVVKAAVTIPSLSVAQRKALYQAASANGMM